ncbi:FAD-dependent oxidoreductase [Nocardia sp. R6R-6]|uniref:FAD-dependent oxidoreductase n=1 Tax=Nocardia sp. R6R-6 TaxID=3459303 RepID=UPI00403E2F3B
MLPRDVVIVGAGLGGFRCAQSLRRGGFPGTITVIGDELHRPYDRPPLSKQLLGGSYSAEQCMLAGEIEDVQWRLGVAARGLDAGARTVALTDGSTLDCESLVVATGRRSRGWRGAVPSRGVHTIRSLDDVADLRRDLVEAKRVVVIGAGFIGCEAAATLRGADIAVDVVDVASAPMTVLGPQAAAYARAAHEEHGVRFFLERGVDRIVGDERVRAVELDDGTRLPADVVLVAIGSIANTEWLEGSGLMLRGGTLVCDDTGAVLNSAGDPIDSVFAVGDVASWPHPHAQDAACIEHWSNARDMADVVAGNLLRPRGVSRAAIRSVPSFWSDQYDLKIKSVGLLRAADEFTVIEDRPSKRAILIEGRRRGTPIAAIAFNMNRAIVRYQRELAAEVSV